jgi:NAD(P)-dependent dehydrogenase (short-subunit alcohol dehydrogenase family)
VTDRRVAIVTAASKGIGAGIARMLAADGWTLVLLARSDAIQAVTQSLGAVAVTGSVTDPADLARAVDLAVTRFGRLDAVVTNTGHPPKGDLLAITDQQWGEGHDLVLRPVLTLARLATPIMERQGGGSFVNVSSLWAVEPHLDSPVSSTYRAALAAYTKLYSDRYAKAGIRMNAVLPGFIDSHPVADKTLAAIPVGRPGTPDEVGKLVAYLVSPAAAYLTGQSIRIDGGLTRSL